MKKNTIILGLVFVCIGFLGAFFVFKSLTAEKPKVIPASSATAKQQASILTKQAPTSVPIDKNQTPPTITTTPRINTQAPLQEKKQDKIDEDQEIKDKIPTLILNGIFASDAGNIALINNRIVKEGDQISGVNVVRIYPSKVELEMGSQKITLRVK